MVTLPEPQEWWSRDFPHSCRLTAALGRPSLLKSAEFLTDLAARTALSVIAAAAATSEMRVAASCILIMVETSPFSRGCAERGACALSTRSCDRLEASNMRCHRPALRDAKSLPAATCLPTRHDHSNNEPQRDKQRPLISATRFVVEL